MGGASDFVKAMPLYNLIAPERPNLPETPEPPKTRTPVDEATRKARASQQAMAASANTVNRAQRTGLGIANSGVKTLLGQ